MVKRFGAVGLVVKEGLSEALGAARTVRAFAEVQGLPFLACPVSALLLDQTENVLDKPELVLQAGLIVSLGGDGTLLSVARHVRTDGLTLIGVNFGRLGFLTEVSSGELETVLDQVSNGAARSYSRSLLSVSVERNAVEVWSSQALNEVAVMSQTRERLIELDLRANGEEVMQMRSDGVIVATPTGSTAYSLSAGGSIVEPSLDAMLITPVCAHSLTARPLVLSMERTLEMRVPEAEPSAGVHLDGQESFGLVSGDVVRVGRARCRISLIRSPSHTYFEILRNKLRWGYSFTG